MTKWINPLLITLALTVLAGCAAEKEVKLSVNGNKVTGLRRGQVLQLEFDANASTGYLWESRELDNKNILAEIGKSRYVHKTRRIGAGGTQIFRYETIKRGRARIAFEYRRPWEKDAEPAKRYVVQVIVY